MDHEMSKAKPHVLIAGAGIGGLTAALALLKEGIDCDLYEQAAELREVGAGLQLAPNGSRVLIKLGLEQAVRDVGVPTGDKVVRLWSTGQSWSLFDPKEPPPTLRFGAPMFLMHRGDLQALLVHAVRALKPGAIHLGSHAIGFEQDEHGVTLRLASGEVARGDVLVGADGLHSRIRQQMFGPAAPRFTGIMAWRGLAPVDGLSEHLRRPMATQWLGPRGHVTCYPVRRGKLLNMVGEVQRDDWRSESWVQEGSKEECLRDFNGWHADLREIVANVDRVFKWALFLRDPLPEWSRGRVTLLGDACHAMLPFLGQGANMAIEDGLILARAIALNVDSPERALRRYQGARASRTSEVVRRSGAMAETFHNPALEDAGACEKYIEANWNLERIRNRYDEIYLYDATKAEL